MTGTPYDQWVNLATGHFQGRASVWLKNICVPWQMVTWQQFCPILSDRFTEATVHEAVEMLKNVQQNSSVAGYINRFEQSMALVKRDHPFLQENFLMSCFICGLKADIKHDVCGQRPMGIMQCYWYAKTYEKAAASWVPALPHPSRQKSFTPVHIHHRQIAPVTQGTDKQQHTNGPRAPNLCWYCREPWNRQHKCRIEKTIHILQELEEDITETPTEEEAQPDAQYHTAPNTPDKEAPMQQCCQISIHAAEGTPGPATLCILLIIAGKKFVALVDSGSSDTFINYRFALDCNVTLTPSPIRKVSVAGGRQLISNRSIPNCPYSIAGKPFSIHFQSVTITNIRYYFGSRLVKIIQPCKHGFD